MADLYPRFGRTMEWDTCAPQAVLEAAGGAVRDAGRQPLLATASRAGTIRTSSAGACDPVSGWLRQHSTSADGNAPTLGGFAERSGSGLRLFPALFGAHVRRASMRR